MNRLYGISLFILVIWTSMIATNGALVGLGSRIVGGQQAAEGAYPYQVSLRSNHTHFCGGSIITTLHVLTSAQCAPSTLVLSQVTVISGTNSLASGGETHGVALITRHPEYIGWANYWRNDIAIITLTAPMTFTPLQSVIPVATVDPPVGSEAIMSGWGVFFPGSSALPTRLQILELTILDNTVCEELMQINGIRDAHLCASKGYGYSACTGDGGSPLVYNGTIIGVVSQLWSVCAAGGPDVFARVPELIEFIEEVTELSLSQNNHRPNV